MPVPVCRKRGCQREHADGSWYCEEHSGNHVPVPGAPRSLVARLRNRPSCSTCRERMAEAADEIERLRTLVRELDEARAKLKAVVWERDSLRVQFVTVQMLVNEQAEDDGCWFDAETAPEAYLQQELRRLHAAIEGDAARRLLGEEK